MTETLDIKITKTKHSRLNETVLTTYHLEKHFLTTCLWPTMPMVNGKNFRGRSLRRNWV